MSFITTGSFRDVLYIVSCSLFIYGLFGLTRPTTAVRGNRIAAAGMGVAIVNGLALRAHRAPGVHATELTGNARQIYAATYGDPPDPPATTGASARCRRGSAVISSRFGCSHNAAFVPAGPTHSL